MELSRKLTQMNADELRNLTATLLAQLADREAQISKKDAELSAQTAQIASRDQELKAKQLKIDQLTHEMAILKRYRFDRKSEQMDPAQRSLLDESIDADIEAIFLEIETLKLPSTVAAKEKPRRVALPASLPRIHQPTASRRDGSSVMSRPLLCSASHGGSPLRPLACVPII